MNLIAILSQPSSIPFSIPILHTFGAGLKIPALKFPPTPECRPDPIAPLFFPFLLPINSKLNSRKRNDIAILGEAAAALHLHAQSGCPRRSAEHWHGRLGRHPDRNPGREPGRIPVWPPKSLKFPSRSQCRETRAHFPARCRAAGLCGGASF